MTTTLTQCPPQSTCENQIRQPLVRPRANIIDVGDAWMLAVELPGVDESAVDVTLERGVLTIRAESPSFQPEGLRQCHCEFTGRAFHRAFRVPEDVDAGSIDAALKQGVLTLKLNKAPQAQPQKVVVKAVT